MELRHLRAFVEVAGKRHFGRAAEAMNLTQPALTQRIQSLEREVGLRLFERGPREVRLTAAGQVLLPYAKNLVQIEDRALRELKDSAAGLAGRLRIAYLSHGPVAMPGKVVAEFRRRYPTVWVETTSGHSGWNAERLADGLVDAAFINPGFAGIPTESPDGITVRLLRRDTVLVAMPRSHQLAELEEVPVKALRRERLIMFSSTTFQAFSARLERWLARHIGADPNVVAHEPPDQALEAVARSTSLITFANGSRAESAPVPGVAYRRLTPEPLIDFGVAYVRDDKSPTVANLLQLIDEIAEYDPGEVPAGSELLSADKP
jgi:DNA-binding transcriptional LysR family regulator